MTARLLIVEDAAENILALTSVLAKHGYELSAANNGEQAIRVLENVQPDLILLDIVMPGLDGFETCVRIKASTQWRDIPIIFLTSRTDSSDIVRGFEVGAVDYVSKPFHAAELLVRVGTHLAIDRLYRENRRLLLNVLPETIADRLKKGPDIVADGFEDVSVLFADVVGFTALTARLAPVALIRLLNRVFSGFDELSERYGLEKIKTIGDAYMVAGGLFERDDDHLAAMATMALAMQERVRTIRSECDEITLRIGLHTGPVTAGVIGTSKFSYDIWGDTVNIASRLQTSAAPNAIHVSEAAFTRLRERFTFNDPSELVLKGRGSMKCYALSGVV